MKVKEKGHTIVITKTNETVADFLEKITNEYNQFKEKNLIIDLPNEHSIDIQYFESLNEKHRTNKKSFVLVLESIDLDNWDDEIIVVPTLQEAHDIIEMEEIERDLGF